MPDPYTHTMRSLGPILFIILAAAVVVGMVLQQRLLSRLRIQHVQTWEALGRPSLFMNNSMANNLSVLKFLWRRDYLTLGDDGLIRLADFLRIYQLVYACFFAVFFVLINLSWQKA